MEASANRGGTGRCGTDTGALSFWEVVPAVSHPAQDVVAKHRQDHAPDRGHLVLHERQVVQNKICLNPKSTLQALCRGSHQS